MLKKVTSKAKKDDFKEVKERIAKCWCGECINYCGTNPGSADRIYAARRDVPSPK
jgi:hypothetical protein